MKEFDMDYIFKSGVHEYQTVREVLMEDKEYLLQKEIYNLLTDDVKERIGKIEHQVIDANVLSYISKCVHIPIDSNSLNELETENAFNKIYIIS